MHKERVTSGKFEANMYGHNKRSEEWSIERERERDVGEIKRKERKSLTVEINVNIGGRCYGEGGGKKREKKKRTISTDEKRGWFEVVACRITLRYHNKGGSKNKKKKEKERDLSYTWKINVRARLKKKEGEKEREPCKLWVLLKTAHLRPRQ